MSFRTASAATARRIVAVAAILHVAVATFPAGYYPLHAGLDISWVFGLNLFLNSRFHFGSDVNFTYGPLGFLLYPANVGNDVLLAFLFRGAVAGLTILSLGFLARGRICGLALFAAGNAIALGLGHTFDFHILIVAALAAFAALERRSIAGLLALAAISAPLWLAKFSVGIGVATVVATAAVTWRIGCAGSIASSVAILLSHAASLLCAGWALLGSLSSLGLWLRASLEIAGWYSVALSYDPGWTDVRKGIAVCALFLAAGAVLFRMRRAAVLPFALLAGSLFVAFKSGFVREDGHVKSFFGFAAAALATPLLTNVPAREKWIGAAALLLAAGLGVRGELKRKYLDRGVFVDAASGKQGLRAIDRGWRWRATRLDLDRLTAGSIAPDRLPDEVLKVIGAGTVLVTPWELVHCLANQLQCVPLQTLQEYSAYTPYLDAITAAHLEASSSPDFVLVHTLQSTDDRHVILDGPLTWRSLIGRYEPVRLHTADVVLLRRRSSATRLQPVPVSTGWLGTGEWIPVPDTGDFVFAEMHFQLSPLGRLLKFAYRIPPAYIELRRAGGTIERRRLILETSVNGILVQPFAAGLRDLAALFLGRGDRVVALRIVGPAMPYYRETAALRWLADPGHPDLSRR
jgi:hypothetical protein